ncbi:MAG: alpha/beta hydrolase [Chloroflexota bacterium]|nr:alpha/beta hydrolase [Chloroflexota bacterium]MDE2685735.1 alpha/beta hydrolase [Chloroflexota bacterium]
MAAVDYSVLDHPDGSGRSFHPLRGWSDTPDGAVDYGIAVADGTVLSSRFFAVGRENPTVLFFYGGGENVARYDEIAPHYNGIGANFFLADYRGHGASSGSPSFNTMLSDAHDVLNWLIDTMGALRFTGPVYVMGRSMGRHAAGELAVNAADRINGVIIESGRANLGRYAQGLDPDVAQALEDDYQAKFYSISIPALVIHGQWDESAPLADAVDMFNRLETPNKHLEIIPGAGHNDLMYVEMRQYFRAVRGFMARYAEKG